MDVNALRYFLAVIEARSMRGAAEDLHIAQSALSRQIATLEKELGVPLLMRLPRGVRPTEAGQMLARRARSIMDQFASAHDEIGALRGLHVGKVTVAVIEPLADGLLMTCVRRMQKDHPGISFDIRVGNSSKVVTILREGVVELAMAYNPPYDRDLLVRAQSHVPLAAIVWDGHDLAKQESCTLADVSKWPLVLPPAGSPTRMLIDESARRSALALPHVALESDSVPVRLAFLQQTNAVAIMANISGRMAQTGQSVQTVPINDSILSTGTLQLLTSRDHNLSQAASAFERILRRAMRSI